MGQRLPYLPAPFDRGGVRVRAVSPLALDAKTIESWRHLSERALEPNAYLTPMFVLPALAHMDSHQSVKIFLIETAGGDLIGAGVFTTKPLLPFFPLRSLVGYRSKHSYLTGLLVHREHASSAVDAFFEFASRPGTRWHGIRFDLLGADSSLCALLIETARQRNIAWSESERTRRAVLLPKNDDAKTSIGRISTHRLKDLRRCLRRLGESGKVAWRVRSGENCTDDVIERFISLEHMGWKGKARTSLRSHPQHEQFFRTMIAQFRESGRVFFTELLHEGRVIASTCNLMSGNSGFAFKIGWDPDYARYSPGMLNELGLLLEGSDVVGQLDSVDSGSVEGSFIEKLWPDRREVVSGTFATTKAGKLICAMAAMRRRMMLVATGLRTGIQKSFPSARPVEEPSARTATKTAAALPTSGSGRHRETAPPELAQIE